MELAFKQSYPDRAGDDPASAPEHVLLLDTARALDEVQVILDRSRERASRFEALRRKAVSDQEKLIGAQARRIEALERQLAGVQVIGDEQATALDQALALIVDLEERMDALERLNAELQAAAPSNVPARPQDPRPGESHDLSRPYGSGTDLVRYGAFVKARAA